MRGLILPHIASKSGSMGQIFSMFVEQPTFYRHVGKTSLYVCQNVLFILFTAIHLRLKLLYWFTLGLHPTVGVTATMLIKWLIHVMFCVVAQTKENSVYYVSFFFFFTKLHFSTTHFSNGLMPKKGTVAAVCMLVFMWGHWFLLEVMTPSSLGFTWHLWKFM